MKFSVRFFIIALIFFVFTFLFKPPVYAQSNSFQNNYSQEGYTIPNTNPDVPKNLHTLSQSILIDVLSSLACQLAGVDPINPKQKCLGIDSTTGKIGFVENGKGVLGLMSNAIAMLYTPPIHTSDYFRYLAGNFGITKDSYAQQNGVGLATIEPISGLWQVFRNIVYLLFVVVFVLIGVGIMLRARIDPRTVMTIQNQIPKIIIALILITFSFAISGFLIDIMWVIILLVTSTLTPFTPGFPSDANFITPFGLLNIVPSTSGGLGGMFSIMSNVAGFIGSSIFNAGFTANNVNTLVKLPSSSCDPGFLGLGLLACFLGGVLSSVLGAILGFFLGIAVGLVAFFVVAIALIYALFKLWFELLKAYISILIDIIFAPFWIVAGLIPGGGEKVGFGAWLRDMLGNLMAFPAAIALFYLAAVFTTQFNHNATTFFLPPLIGPQGNNFGPVIAFGLIMMAPNVVKITKAAFKSSGTGMGLAGGALGIAAAGALGGSIKSRMYYRNPQTGEVSGPAANVQRNVTSKISNSGVGGSAGRLTLPIRTNRLARLAWKPHERSAWNNTIAGGGSREDANSARRAAIDRTETTPPVTPEETQRAQREQADREG